MNNDKGENNMKEHENETISDNHSLYQKDTIIPKLDPKSWTINIERILDNLRINCAQLSNYHRYKYAHCKKQIKWFKIPVIILSGINTFVSVGLSEQISQTYISIGTAIISLMCGIITSIEMFMKYQDKMETELHTYKTYYKISMDIYAMISIDKNLRPKNGQDFLREQMEEYSKIKHNSRPEDHFDLVHDLISDIDEMIVYQRKSEKYPERKEKWINKIEMIPYLDDLEQSKVSEFISYDKYRHPHKHALRMQVKKLEKKKRITQRAIDKEYLRENPDKDNQGWFGRRWYGEHIQAIDTDSEKNDNSNSDDDVSVISTNNYKIILNKHDMKNNINEFISEFLKNFGRLPEEREVQEYMKEKCIQLNDFSSYYNDALNAYYITENGNIFPIIDKQKRNEQIEILKKVDKINEQISKEDMKTNNENLSIIIDDNDLDNDDLDSDDNPV